MQLILDKKSDPRLLGKKFLNRRFLLSEKENLNMIVKDAKGNELLEVIDVPEEQAEKMYNPINH